tara:strand:- start:19780 stop:20247 length:468 start_codon:yes stop_codon:yes gene_type:complete
MEISLSTSVELELKKENLKWMTYLKQQLTSERKSKSSLMPNFLEQAKEFRTVNDQPIGTGEKLSLQRSLISEEYREFLNSIDYQEGDENKLKELSDLVYVCYQYAAAAGWDLNEALDRVHISNMSKATDGKILKNEHGKVLKGPNYKPPNLKDLV